MPLYEYQCDACGSRFEVIQKFSDSAPGACRICGSGPVKRLLSSPAIQFKGSGWYITDYARKPEKGAGQAGKDASSEEAAAKTDKPTAESSSVPPTASAPQPTAASSTPAVSRQDKSGKADS